MTQVYLLRAKAHSQGEVYPVLPTLVRVHQLYVPKLAVMGNFSNTPSMVLNKGKVIFIDHSAVLHEYARLLYDGKLYAVRQGEVNASTIDDVILRHRQLFQKQEDFVQEKIKVAKGFGTLWEALPWSKMR